MDYQKILQEIQQEIIPLFCEGKVADYIPALAEVDPKQFAMSITLLNGTQYGVGNVDTLFSIQSISKVFSLTLALESLGKDLYKRVGVEPSGNAFNSLVQLEYEHGIPRNPFINAGAIVVVDALLKGENSSESTFQNLLNFIRDIADDQSINNDPIVVESEMISGYRNLSLAALMKSFNNLDHMPVTVLKTYFKLCAITMNTTQLSRAMLYLANRGTDPLSNKKFTASHRAKRINAIMLTCGHYDASGEFAFHVGLPGKSGVGGGIVAIVPGLMGICVYSPELNERGNSLIGTKALELFTTKTKLSIF